MTPSRLIETLTRLDGSVYGVAFSPDDTLLATVGYDRTVRLWGLARHTGWRRTLSGHKDAVRGVAFRPDAHSRLALRAGPRHDRGHAGRARPWG